jgi:hypothetical protein
LLAAFELYYQFHKLTGPAYLIAPPVIPGTRTDNIHAAQRQQNIFGIRVIAVSMAVIGAGIITIGVLAPGFSAIVIAVGAFIFVVAAAIWVSVRNTLNLPVKEPIIQTVTEE